MTYLHINWHMPYFFIKQTIDVSRIVLLYSRKLRDRQGASPPYSPVATNNIWDDGSADSPAAPSLSFGSNRRPWDPTAPVQGADRNVIAGAFAAAGGREGLFESG